MVANAGKAGTFSVSGGLFHQVHSSFDDIIGEYFLPNPNVWWFREKDINLYELELQRNKQIVLGYEKHFNDLHTFSTEFYYKLYDREYSPVDPDEKAYFEVAPYDTSRDHLKEPSGKKKVYGFEMVFQKKKYDAFYYFFSYSLSTAENKYTNGKYYTDENNFRNVFSCVLGTNFLKHHGLSVRFSAMQGRPYSKQIVVDNGNFKEAIYDTTVDYYSERFAPVFLLSARYNFMRYKKWGNFTGYVEVINILNRETVIDREFDGSTGKFEYITTNGIVPLVGLTVDF
jgi:hypothetical protein